jgi:hypothetical protein
MAQITDGMRESDVMKIMGPPDDSKAYVTGKAFIPFYYGGDSTRFAAYWKGQGRVIFQGGNAVGRRPRQGRPRRVRSERRRLRRHEVAGAPRLTRGRASAL